MQKTISAKWILLGIFVLKFHKLFYSYSACCAKFYKVYNVPQNRDR